MATEVRRDHTGPLTVRVEELDPSDVVLVKDIGWLNARFQTQESMRGLKESMEFDGVSTSVPFCFRFPELEGERPAPCYVVLSGNGRTEAARLAGVKQFYMLCDDLVPYDRMKALQLAHNAREGEDDPHILEAIYHEIGEVELKKYSGLNDEVLAALKHVDVPAIREAPMDYRTVTFEFLPNEVERLTAMIEEVNSLYKGEHIVAHRCDYQPFMEAVELAKGAYGVRNGAMAIGIVLDVFERNRVDLQSGYLDENGEAEDRSGWVPLATLFGGDAIPGEAASVIARAVKLMQKQGDVSKEHAWKAVEYMAAEFLAGAQQETNDGT
jgi:hypothetical protein